MLIKRPFQILEKALFFVAEMCLQTPKKRLNYGDKADFKAKMSQNRVFFAPKSPKTVKKSAKKLEIYVDTR